ncbi:hypothetical protein K432DRAFT_420496 [Lepidopterella palustris CBS 459.81]|uniref:Fungal-type protein kinase domain-containing protein n=1 Tax=Lepidopterella palustris CBS 459.81 TaxID=1314670 RepID=A0A8E2DYH0_9PEZI|nr:hypothetical protein K432DRAFT_420496 [Lepidopterella palustris CBS 459.81]
MRLWKFNRLGGVASRPFNRNGQAKRLCLEKLIKRQRSVTSRKYKKRPEEGLLLKEVIEARVKNIAQYYHHKTVHIRGAVNNTRNNHKLLLNAKILHRNILVGNVILYKREDDSFLINLNFTVKIDREKASGAPSKTRTKVFIVIGALYGKDHNFMYNLELFFWRSRTEYESWNYKPIKKLTKIKTSKLRKVVFLEGKRWLRENRQLYS